MGVRRAVDIVLGIAQNKGPEHIYTYGPLIHNPQTVALLKKRNILPVENIDDIEEGVVVVRAHGISPRDREKIREKGLTIVDATCPKVARVQAIIKKHVSLGYDVIIAGDREHPEVMGLLGYASGRGIVVSEVDEVDDLPLLERVCVVAQTTQNAGKYMEIVKSVQQKYPESVIFNTVCDSTDRRQTEIKKLAAEVDAMIIVGGKNSANTQRLVAISRESDVPSYHVETANDLRSIDLEGVKKVGVSAGASTPNWITDDVLNYLTLYRRGDSKKALGRFYQLWVFSVQTDIYSAIGAGCLALVSMLLQELRISLVNILIAAFFVFGMHTLNRLRNRQFGRIAGSFRDETYMRHRGVYLTVALVSLFLALVLSSTIGFASLFCLLIISFFGALYDLKILPFSWKVTRLRDIPGSKNIFMAVAWAVVAAMIPAITVDLRATSGMVISFLLVFSIVFVKSTLSDMVDVQSDRLVGRETIPVIIGERITRMLIKGISVVMGAGLVAVVIAAYTPLLTLGLLLPVFYVWICLELCDKKAQFSSVVMEGLFGTNYILAGVSVYVWFVIDRFVS